VIEESESAWSSPIVMVTKPGKVRTDHLICTLAYHFYEWDPCTFQKVD